MKYFSCLLLSFLLIATFCQGQNCTINAGVNSSVCLGQPILLDGSLGGPANSSSVKWALVSQPAGANVTINNTNSLLTNVGNVSIVGIYTFSLNAVCGDGVAIVDQVSVTVNPVPSVPILSGSSNFPCYNGGPVNLSATSPGPGETVSWSLVGGASGTFGSSASANTTFTPTFPIEECAATSSITIRYTIRNADGCESSATRNYTFARNYSLYATASPTQVCGNTTFLKGSCPGSGTVSWTQISGPNTALIGNANVRNTTAGGLTAGNYVFRYTVSGGCSPGTADVNVTVSGSSAVTQANAGTDQYHCQIPDMVPLTANKPAVGETGTWSQLSGGATTIAVPTHFNTTASGMTNQGAPYTYLYTISNGTCFTTDSVTIYKRPEITLTGADSEVCQGTGTGQITPISTSSYGYNQLDTAIVNITFISGPTGAVVNTAVRKGTGGGASVISFQNLSVGRTVTWNLSRSDLYSQSINQNSLLYNLDFLFRVNDFVGVFKFRVSMTTACGTVEKEVTITRGLTGPGVNAGTDVALPCNTTSATLAGNLADNKGLWSALQLPAGATNPFTPANQALRNPPISGLIAGTYVFRYTNNMGPSCTANQFDEVKLVVSNTPPPAPNAGADVAGCAGSMTLNGSTPPADAFANWTVVSPAASGITFSNPSASNPTINNLQPNTSYTLRYTFTNGCGSSFDEVSINTNASTGPSKPTITSATLANCATLTRTLPSNVSIVVNHPALDPGTVATWSVVTVPGGIVHTATANNATSTTVALQNVTQSTVFSIVYTLSNASCPSSIVSDTLTGYIRKSTDAATYSAGPSQQICSVQSYPVTVNLTGSASTGPVHWSQIYSSVGGQAAIATPSNSSTTVTIPADGMYRFQYEIKSGTDPGCQGLLGQDIMQVTTSSPGLIALAGDDIQFCNSTGVTTLNASVVGNGRWEVYQVLNGSAPVIGTVNSASSNLTFSGSGSAYLRWNSYGSIMECGPSSSDLVKVTYTAPSSAGSDIRLCDATSINLSAANSEPATGTWSQLSGPGASIQNTSNPQTLVSGLTDGSYLFRYTVDNGTGCTTTDDVSVLISSSSDVADAGPDADACSGGTNKIQLDAGLPQTGSTGTWSLTSRPAGTAEGSFSDIHDPLAIYDGMTQPGKYVFAWTVSNGICSSTDYVEFTSTATPCTLPVTLVSFTAREENGIAALHWITSEESNFSHFELQYSVNAKTFLKLADVSSNNHSGQPYSYIHHQLDHKGYYRLKMIDRDATFAYSRIISVELKRPEIVIFSNPTPDLLQIKGLRGGENVRVYDKQGKILMVLENIKVGQKIDLAHFIPGIYTVEIVMEGGQTFRGKVIKSN
ncbi:PKD domain-containing protein [Dyadobacter sp. CY312]|uniref:PKD domain-containing protein n=1 Tax=Dyadobacter sp. CY312 TaxID=2907303 RepID=UPI001F195584|nr:T9SS type A sorting domain-containing protein [Dyadobacter sp. CY312]MCE7044105.1 T9SS type A sorting domain-containing protein [Dyadobacter sp. CY312]